MTTNLRTLGPNEARVVLALSEHGRTTVRAAEVIEILGVESTARKVIHNLVRKGWFVRLIGGRYLFLPPEYGPERLGENNAVAIASAVADPSYVGWWAAASFHGLTTQKPVAVGVAVLRQMSSRIIEGSEILFVTVHRRKLCASISLERVVSERSSSVSDRPGAVRQAREVDFRLADIQSRSILARQAPVCLPRRGEARSAE